MEPQKEQEQNNYKEHVDIVKEKELRGGKHQEQKEEHIQQGDQKVITPGDSDCVVEDLEKGGVLPPSTFREVEALQPLHPKQLG